MILRRLIVWLFLTLLSYVTAVIRVILLNSWTGDNLVVSENRASVIAIVGRSRFTRRLVLIAGRKGSSSSPSAAIKLTRQLLRSWRGILFRELHYIILFRPRILDRAGVIFAGGSRDALVHNPLVTPSLLSISRRDYLDRLSGYKAPPKFVRTFSHPRGFFGQLWEPTTPLAGKFGFNTICVPETFWYSTLNIFVSLELKFHLKLNLLSKLKAVDKLVLYIHTLFKFNRGKFLFSRYIARSAAKTRLVDKN